MENLDIYIKIEAVKGTGKGAKDRTPVAQNAGRDFSFRDFPPSKNSSKQDYRCRIVLPPLDIDPDRTFKVEVVHDNTVIGDAVIGECTEQISHFFEPSTWKPYQIYALPGNNEVAHFRFKLHYAIKDPKGKLHQHFAGSVRATMDIQQDAQGNDVLEMEFKSCLSLRDINIPTIVGESCNMKGTVMVVGLFLGYFVTGLLVYSLVPYSWISDPNDDGAFCSVQNFTGVPESEHLESPGFGHRLAQSFYFLCVMATTVGYGDIKPTNDAPVMKIFTMIYGLWGIMVLGLFVGVATEARSRINAKMFELFDNHKKNRQRIADLSLLASTSEPERKKGCFAENAQLYTRLIAAVILFTIVIGIGCLIYGVLIVTSDMHSEKTFVDCLYYSVITATTIGYGDEAPVTIAGRILGAIYLLIALPSFANLAAVFFEIPLERRKKWAEEQVLQQYGEELEEDELRSLIQHAGGGVDELGNQIEKCTRAQFCIAMLLKLKKIKPADVKAATNVFNKLDRNSNGDLDAADVVDE